MNYEKMWDALKTLLLVREDNRTLELIQRVEDNFSPPRGSDMYEGAKKLLREIRTKGSKCNFTLSNSSVIKAVVVVDVDADNLTYKFPGKDLLHSLMYSTITSIEEVK